MKRSHVLYGVCLALLVVVALGLRAYRLHELVIWLGDQGRDVTATWRMLETGEPALLGPGASVGHFQRGPIYYYMLLAGLAAGGGNPFGAALVPAVLDAAIIILLFSAGRMMGSSFGGLAAAALYATAGSTVNLARAFSNPSVLPFFSILLAVALAQWVQGKLRFVPIVVGVLVAAWQIHDQALLLAVWTLGVLVIWRPPITRHVALVSGIVALALVLPLAWYEAAHEWVNLRAMAAFVGSALVGSTGAGAVDGIVGRLAQTGQVVHAYLPFEGIAHWLLVLGAAAGWLLLLAAAWTTRKPVLGVFASYGILPLFYLVWPGPVYASNVEIALPVPFLLLGYGVGRSAALDRRAALAVGALVVLVCGASLTDTFSRIAAAAPQANSLGTAERVVERIRARAGGKPVLWRLESSQQNTEAYESPWRYLLAWRGVNLAAMSDAETVMIVVPADYDTGARQAGKVIDGVRVVWFAPPRPVGENLLRRAPLTTAADVSQWVLRAPPGASISWDAAEDGLRLDGTEGAGQVTAVKRVNVAPDRDYLLRVSAKNASPFVDERVLVLCFDSANGFMATLPFPEGYRVPDSAEWQERSLLLHTPPGCERASIWLQQNGSGTSWFRQIDLSAAQLDLAP